MRKLLAAWAIVGSIWVVDFALFTARGFAWRGDDLGWLYGIAAMSSIWALAVAGRRVSTTEWVCSRLAPFLQLYVLFFVFCVGASLLSYFCASADLPLADPLLRAADHALDFHWRAFDSWIEARPALRLLLFVSYASLTLQPMAVIVASVFSADRELAPDLLLVSMIASLLTLALFLFLPALGKPGVMGDGHILALLRARQGNLRLLSLHDIAELVTFPSFHAAMGVIFIWIAARKWWLALFLIPLNVAMIAATPPMGGHYLIDTIAGCLVSGAAIAIFRCFFPASSLAILRQASRLTAIGAVERR